MATNITIEDDQGRTLSITSANPTIDEGNDPGGARRFRIAYPYDLSPTIPGNRPVYYTPGKANINSDILSGSHIMVIHRPGNNMEINIRG